MDKAQISVRPALPGDFNFVISTWLKSYKSSSYFAKRIRNSIFFFYHHEVVSRLLSREDTKVFIACDLVDPNVIYGYLVQGSHEGVDLVHYVYVKSAFRGLGIARSLTAAAPLNLDRFVFSHWTFSTDGLVDKLPGGTYIPYLLS